MSPFIVFISVTMVPVGLIYTIHQRSARRAEEETGHTAIAEERCGALFDTVRFSTPLVRVAVYEDFVVVAGWNLASEKYTTVQSLQIRPARAGKSEAKFRVQGHVIVLTLPDESTVLAALRGKLQVEPWQA